MFGRGEDLGEVDRIDPGALAMKGAADVHEARVIGRGAVLGPGVEHAADLVREHGHRRIGVLDGERAAEAAALVGVLELDQVDPPDLAEQPLGRIADPEHPLRVAGRVERHPVGEIGADVVDPELVDEERRELEHAGDQVADGLRQPLIAGQLGHLGIELVHHPHARGRRRDDQLGVAEDLDEVPDQRDRLALVAGVVVHLPATGLGGREVDRVAEPLEQAHHGPSGGGEEGVVEARNEQTHAHGSVVPSGQIGHDPGDRLGPSCPLPSSARFSMIIRFHGDPG